MSLFTKLKPTLVIDGKNLEKQIGCLESLTNLNNDGEALRDKELKMLRIGLYGEKQILFELLNSNIPMYIFHDVYYELDDLKAQIDFIVVTEYKIFVIECKNIIGNIIVDSNGNFIREFNNMKEGMYSPITQNERHIDLIVTLILSRQNLLGKFFNRRIKDNVESIIAFTNSKTIIKSNYAPKNIKKKVLRADAVNAYIKKAITSTQAKVFDLENIASFLEYHNISTDKDYTLKYNNYVLDKEVKQNKIINIDDLREQLKQYRLNVSRSENCKPYFIFTNEQMEDLLKFLPKDKEQLLNINGFGKFKVDKYGADILNIINQ